MPETQPKINKTLRGSRFRCRQGVNFAVPLTVEHRWAVADGSNPVLGAYPSKRRPTPAGAACWLGAGADATRTIRPLAETASARRRGIRFVVHLLGRLRLRRVPGARRGGQLFPARVSAA